MADDGPGTLADLQWQVDDLRAQLDEVRGDIRALRDAAKFAQRRVDANEARADANDLRADQSDARADQSDVRAERTHESLESNRQRIEALELGSELDHKLISELQAEGALSRDAAARLEEGLRTSRNLGTAVGIVMAKRGLDERGALELLSLAGEETRRTLHDLADEVVLTGDVDALPAG